MKFFVFLGLVVAYHVVRRADDEVRTLTCESRGSLREGRVVTNVDTECQPAGGEDGRGRAGREVVLVVEGELLEMELPERQVK